jgi:hypothetical protein
MWKKGRPIEIHKCPLAMRELAFQKIRPPFEGWDDFLLAALLADRWSDGSLKRDGRLDFWEMSGAELIRGVEEIFREGLRGAKSKNGRVTGQVGNQVTQFAGDDRLDRIIYSASRAQIEAARSPKGGFTNKMFLVLGVPVPPPPGWQEKLILNHYAGRPVSPNFILHLKTAGGGVAAIGKMR